MSNRVRLVSFFLWLLFLSATVRAQDWTKEDSIRLRQMLSGEREIRLDPEVRKAIEEGTFLPEFPTANLLRSAPGQLPLAADFSEYVRPDTVFKPMEIDSLTPAVFMLVNFKPKRTWKIQEQAYPVLLPFKGPKEKQIGRLPVFISGSVGFGNLFLSEVKDGQRRGSINGTITIRLSVEDLLQLAFSKTARNKRRNQRRANTWKYYNDYP